MGGSRKSVSTNRIRSTTCLCGTNPAAMDIHINASGGWDCNYE